MGKKTHTKSYKISSFIYYVQVIFRCTNFLMTYRKNKQIRLCQYNRWFNERTHVMRNIEKIINLISVDNILQRNGYKKCNKSLNMILIKESLWCLSILVINSLLIDLLFANKFMMKMFFDSLIFYRIMYKLHWYLSHYRNRSWIPFGTTF